MYECHCVTHFITEARGYVIESEPVVVALLNAVKYSAVGLDLLISFSILLMTLITDGKLMMPVLTLIL